MDKDIFKGKFGLERETLRVDENGALARTSHPFSEENFARDFCENQLEIVTPVCESIDSVIECLNALDEKARDTLSSMGEYLWLYSNPPHFETENDIFIARFFGDEAHKSEYREKLEMRYGKRLMLYSGIHFNFSFDEDFLQINGEGTLMDIKNKVYLKLYKYLSRYSWLLVLLSSASPVYDMSLDGDNLTGDGFDGFGSKRNSEKGYWNKFVPVLDYTDLSSYVKSLNRYIDDGTLISAAELYLPVRLKPPGDNSLDSLVEKGVDHIELRMFDVNPLSPTGIMKEDIEFAHYFMIYLRSLPDFEYTPVLQKIAVENHKAAAGYDISEIKISGYSAIEAALGILEDMSIYFDGEAEVLKNIAWQRDKLIKNNRYCVQIYEKYKTDYHKKMLDDMKKRLLD